MSSRNDDLSLPYVGLSQGERNRASRARDKYSQGGYETAPLDEFLQGMFGKERAEGSVLDRSDAPEPVTDLHRPTQKAAPLSFGLGTLQERRDRANDLGQRAGIFADVIDMPKAAAGAGIGLLGALKRSGKSGDALEGVSDAVRARKAVDNVFNKPTAAKDVVDDPLVQAIKGTPASARVDEKLAALAPAPARAVQAPREIKGDKRFKGGDKKGIFRGTEAFGGITPQKLTHARMSYLADAEAGAPHSKYWYDDTSKAIYDLAGGDVDKADKLAHALSVTSSSTGVAPNAMYGFRAWNQDLVGDKIHTGKYPTRMSSDIERGFSGEDVARGLKRDPYKAGLSVHWRPDPDLRPTNDIHQMRAWGVRDPKTGKPWSKGVSEAGHRFIDEQSRYATGELNKRALAQGNEPDWNNYRAQAAAWAPQRVKSGQAETLEEASKHYGDFIDDYSANVTREWVPGTTTGHLQEMLRDAASKKKYSDVMEDVVLGREGIDKLASMMGALSSPTLANRGVYEGVTSPGYVSRIPVGKATGSHAMDSSSEAAVRGVAGAHGLVGLQDQSAYNFLSGKPSNRAVGGFRFERSLPGVKDPEVRQLLPFDEQELEALAGKLPPNSGVDIPQTDPRGARALYFDDPYEDVAQSYNTAARLGGGMDASQASTATRGAFKEEDSARKKLVDQLRATASEFNSELVPHERHGGLFPTKDDGYSKPDKWSAKPFIEAIEQGGRKMVGGFNEAMKTMAPQLLERTQQLAAQHGWTQAPFYEPMMKALGTGGLDALKELVRQGIVPVAVLSTLAAALYGGGEEAPS